MFAVLIFTAATHTGRQGARDIALAAIFAVFIFAEAGLSVKTAKFYTTQKFPAIQYTSEPCVTWMPVMCWTTFPTEESKAAVQDCWLIWPHHELFLPLTHT